ncbi:MAG: cytochrome d ubiquinol oxidase subunit II [Bacteroides sp.]|nr:cytochrome d ubiquinol oxidase subunit II [Bacteroidales bacterium]MBD5242821.1 cytochrome d ubiquinol oxidase subunit II [Barnesiella sp.]MBD5315801.1 cytochrome d ubiquinol oxidase subunit II [Bacteroides sp.]MDE7450215.1 cytochrome d ubiquinol oxidase subunit II [Paramuribaculum sp.]
MELFYLQAYWWILISVLGAALVFLLFVQGGQTLLWGAETKLQRTMMVNSLGRKWELTFTTLVVFGGAFFASFPLFYSTSFGGAYWLWMLILISFVLQAVSYKYRREPGNLYGTRTYDIFLFFNGCVGCILLGVAVAMMFFGGEFTVTMTNVLDTSAPVISVWAPSHGIEAIFNWKNLLLGFAVLFLARTQAALYFQLNIDGDDALFKANKRRVLVNGVIFVVFFLAFMGVLLTSRGLQATSQGGIPTLLHSFEWVDYKYFHNYITLWWCLIMLLLGVVAVLYGIGAGALCKHFKNGLWFTGLGATLVVISLFWVAGFNDTPYFPSLLDPNCSLSIRNSSSSHFTLEVMSWVSVIIPFVLGYIIYVWYALRKPITPKEMETPGEEKY